MQCESGEPAINPLFDSGAFSRILEKVVESATLPKFEDLIDDYNIKDYNIDKIGIDDVKEFYAEVVNKYKHRDVKRNWCQNQLRIFVWLVFHYAQAIGVQVDKFTNDHWATISSVFFTKDMEDCKFELMSMSKSPISNSAWTPEQDQMLIEILKKMNYQNKWNDIAKQLYKQSNAMYVRKPKQCRERWRNYLDPVLQKGEWKAEEDRKLLELVLDLGKKWSGIAKQLKTRTEHSVKNRFRSLIKKFSKNIPGQKKPRKKSTKDLELVKGIIQEMDKTQKSNSLELNNITSTTKQSSVRDSKEAKDREKEREELERFYPISPNSAFRYCSRAEYPPMIVVTSPKLLSPSGYSKNIDWNDSTRDAYFL